MAVFVLDKCKEPLMPTKLYPFTIRLKDRIGGDLQPFRIKIDPGSKHTGVTVVREKETNHTENGEVKKEIDVLNLFQIKHRGKVISEALTSRRSKRLARFDNRTRPRGWLAPSLMHRIDTTTSLINKLQKRLPITAISMELVRFDEVREYLLEKWKRQCAYCNATQIPLEVEHIIPRSKGGTNRISNLILACHSCNEKKGCRSIKDFLEKKLKFCKRLKKEIRSLLKMLPLSIASENTQDESQ